MKKSLLAVAMIAAFAPVASAQYFNGFETDIAGWETPTRVPSGTGGIASSAGSFHATTAAGAGDFTRWGGYNFGAGNAVPTAFHEYSTSVDIYLNVGGGWANDTRFDFSSAINNAAGTHRRDFIFNAGFYNDSDGSPGSGSNRFIVSASNNSQPGSAYAKNPGRSPIAILTSGWYTFEHHFYDNGGVLAVDLNIFDASSVLVASWTLSDATDLIAGIGGNRYGWFDFNQFSTLAFDNTIRTDLPLDSDGDGIPDDVDECPNSDLSATVVIDGCDSGVANTLSADGCTISDLIAECAAGATNHGKFVSCVAALTNSLKAQGIITGQQKGAIQSCAGKSSIGK